MQNCNKKFTFPLFESVCLQDGVFLNRKWHEARFRRSYHAYYGCFPSHDLLTDIVVDDIYQQGVFKVRIDYASARETVGKNEIIEKIEKTIQYAPYQIQAIKRLKLVEDNNIDYHLKYSDRDHLNSLFQRRESCDDILIVKNGLITDSSFCNVIFRTQNRWFTSDSPLLTGTMRARLLSEKRIEAVPIRVQDLSQFSEFKLINAMRDMDAVAGYPMSGIA